MIHCQLKGKNRLCRKVPYGDTLGVFLLSLLGNPDLIITHLRWKYDVIKLIYKSHIQKPVSCFFSFSVVKASFLYTFIEKVFGHGWGREAGSDRRSVFWFLLLEFMLSPRYYPGKGLLRLS